MKVLTGRVHTLTYKVGIVMLQLTQMKASEKYPELCCKTKEHHWLTGFLLCLFFVVNAEVCKAGTSNNGAVFEETTRTGQTAAMRKIYLDKNKPFATQVKYAKIIYVIQDDFILSSDVEMPADCTLLFDGGTISGPYTIRGNNTSIEAGLTQIFRTEVLFDGRWSVAQAYPEWFGSVHDNMNATCAAHAINKCFTLSEKVFLSYTGEYYATTNETIVVRGILEGNLQGRNVKDGVNVGVFITFLKSVPTGESFVRIGNRKSGDVDNRTKSCKIKDLYIKTPLKGSSQTAAIEIGHVGGCDIINVWVNHRSVKEKEFTAKELENPLKYCNYGIRLTAIEGSTNSEFLNIENSTFFADIPMYIQRSIDFMRVSNTRFACNDYGFASIYGNSLGSAVLFSQISFNQGLYGIYAQNVTNNVTFDAFRIEQLRSLSIKGQKYGCNIYLEGPDNVSQRCLLTFNSGYFSPNDGVKIKGFKLNAGMAPASIVFNRCSNTTQTVERYSYLFDLSECSDYIKLVCNNCSLSGGRVILNDHMATRGNCERNQMKSSCYPSYIDNLETVSYPLTTNVDGLRTYRYVRESACELTADIFQTISPVSSSQISTNDKTPKIKSIVTREDDNYAHNATYAYKVEMECFGAGIYGKAVFVRKYDTMLNSRGEIARITVGKGTGSLYSIVGDVFKYNNHSDGVLCISDYLSDGGFAIFNHTGGEIILKAKVTQMIDNELFIESFN
mgnify:CR=1 FL=1